MELSEDPGNHGEIISDGKFDGPHGGGGHGAGGTVVMVGRAAGGGEGSGSVGRRE